MEEEAAFITKGLQEGFWAGIPPIKRTFTPPNRSSVSEFGEAFDALVQAELDKGRYLGPFTRAEVEELLGPFQTSPSGIIPKPGRQDKYRLIQNLSYPHRTSIESAVVSINQQINSDDFPCTWGTFLTIALLIARLPAGSQAAVRDVKEAYRTVPLHHSQWPGIVIRLGEDSFAVDTCDCFGLAAGAGVYGRIADTGAMLLRRQGMGPISKWVDDHIFIRIRRDAVQEYNRRREQWAAEIRESGGKQQDGGRIWYRGATKPDGQPEEFDEDCTSPITVQSDEQMGDDELYTYSMRDIDEASERLGIVWESEKDISFRSTVPFAGFLWNLEARTVTITDAKREKYRTAISEWKRSTVHSLDDAQQLYGKLLHICHVIPKGRAYLTSLETFMGVFGNRPFMPRTPPQHTQSDLDWWTEQLTTSSLTRVLRPPQPIIDTRAFSDASSEVGIGIVIDERWRAWRLLPGWKAERRDIGWAEAVGFLFLITTILELWKERARGVHFRVFGDNNGVVEGWWRGRSRNWPTNTIFRRIHQASTDADATFHTRYVTSEENPADDPSRGIYGPIDLLLPRIPIPTELEKYVVDFDEPHTATELRLLREGRAPQPVAKGPGNTHRAPTTGVDENEGFDYWSHAAQHEHD